MFGDSQWITQSQRRSAGRDSSCEHSQQPLSSPRLPSLLRRQLRTRMRVGIPATAIAASGSSAFTTTAAPTDTEACTTLGRAIPGWRTTTSFRAVRDVVSWLRTTRQRTGTAARLMCTSIPDSNSMAQSVTSLLGVRAILVSGIEQRRVDHGPEMTKTRRWRRRFSLDPPSILVAPARA
jgi:hypothetical protein